MDTNVILREIIDPRRLYLELHKDLFDWNRFAFNKGTRVQINVFVYQELSSGLTYRDRYVNLLVSLPQSGREPADRLDYHQLSSPTASYIPLWHHNSFVEQASSHSCAEQWFSLNLGRVRLHATKIDILQALHV